MAESVLPKENAVGVIAGGGKAPKEAVVVAPTPNDAAEIVDSAFEDFSKGSLIAPELVPNAATDNPVGGAVAEVDEALAPN